MLAKLGLAELRWESPMCCCGAVVLWCCGVVCAVCVSVGRGPDFHGFSCV